MVRIGLDIGGTGIQVGAVDESGKIVARSAITTRIDIPFEDQIRDMAGCVLSLFNADTGLTLDDVISVGAGVPGIADREGNVIYCTNLNWRNVPFRKELRKHIDKPVFIDNDANVAALAESMAGVCKGTSSCVFITLGTGIGSGIILNGRIWSGAHGIGGELGHVIMDLDGRHCNCGNRGCLEQYCSATALISFAREVIPYHQESLIWEACGKDPWKINAKIVIDAAKEGDPVAVKIFRRYVNYLSQAVASVVNFLDPEIIVFGGGVSKAGNFLLDAVRREFPRCVIFREQTLPRLELATLGPDAGIIGAALLS